MIRLDDPREELRVLPGIAIHATFVVESRFSAAVKARRDLYIIARTDAVASEGMDGAVARANAYLQAGADAIFPEALTNADMFREQ